MPPRKRPKKGSAPSDTPAPPAKEDAEEDVVELNLGGTLAAALAAPHLTVTAVGSGGLAVPVGTGEMHHLEPATLESAVGRAGGACKVRDLAERLFSGASAAVQRCAKMTLRCHQA